MYRMRGDCAGPKSPSPLQMGLAQWVVTLVALALGVWWYVGPTETRNQNECTICSSPRSDGYTSNR